MIQIPSNNLPTLTKVMASLGGEDYAYYVFDVKHVEKEENSTKKVQIALKVFVPESQRTQAVDNIQDSLDAEDIVSVKNKSGTTLDVMLPDRDKAQVIRIEVKPEGSKGSGGGAAATKIQEAAQCVYAAMRYYCGDVKYFTDDDFKCGWEKTIAPEVKLDDIKSLPQEWQHSSWEGAKESKPPMV